jgi:hypothetical protein
MFTLDTPVAEQALALSRWEEMTSKLQEWFHNPDTEALRVALSVSISHYFKSDEPVWLMVLGPSGTGKTGVIMTALEKLPYTYQLDDLTPTTLLSGYQDRNEKANRRKDFSLLKNIGTVDDRSGIILMPDFTCFMSKRDEQRREIAGQLRRVYDGRLDRSCGAADKMTWEGKVTMVVAGTPEVERAWALMRDLGERFMQVRWARGNGVEQATIAMKQIGKEKVIKEMIREMASNFADPRQITNPIRQSSEAIGLRLIHMAEMIAILRGHVKRERFGGTEIIDVPTPEGPTRIAKALAQVARAHGTLFRKPEVDEEDFRVARRMGLDSIPPQRQGVIWTIANYDPQDYRIGYAQLVRLTPQVPPGAVLRATEDLEALGVLRIDAADRIEKTYEFTDNFRGLWEKALPITKL